MVRLAGNGRKSGRKEQKAGGGRTGKAKPTVKGMGNKGGWLKGSLFLVAAAFFLGYMIYAGGDIKSFFSLVIGVVCGLVGVTYLWSSGKGKKRSSRKK